MRWHYVTLVGLILSPLIQFDVMANTLMGGVKSDSASASARDTTPPVLDVRDFQTPLIDVYPNNRQRVICWTPWHQRLANCLIDNWQHVYFNMGEFKVRQRDYVGHIQIYATPYYGMSARITQSCGDPQVDDFILQLYESADGNPQLYYMEGTRRKSFSYASGFAVHGEPNGRLTLVQARPIQTDYEYLNFD